MLRHVVSRQALHLTQLEDRCVPATLLVDDRADNTNANLFLSLREAILLVNNGGNATAALGRSLTGGEAVQISGSYGNNDTITFRGDFAGTTLSITRDMEDITRRVAIQ